MWRRVGGGEVIGGKTTCGGKVAGGKMTVSVY